MAVQNRISVSFNDEEFLILERLSAHTHKTKAELIRTIVEESLRDNPNRFRRPTTIGVTRQKNIVEPHTLIPGTAMTDFKYDIAFSFAKEDEGLATQLNDLMQDRYKTFLYSKAQEQLVGTDGEKAFNAAFGEQARTVAVLLRPEWGQTPWTRIEETAIRNRAYSQGYDFVMFIVTASRTSTPQWMPKTSIWYDLERFGLPGAATLLEARIRAQGGIAVVETLADRAARLKRAQEFKEEKERFHRSNEGVKASHEAYKRFIDDLKANDRLLRDVGVDIHDVQMGITVLATEGTVLTAHYQLRYGNSLDEAVLKAEFYDGVPPLPNTMPPFRKARGLKAMNFTFQLVGHGRTAWVGSDGKEHSIEALAEYVLKVFMDLQQRKR